MIAGPTPPISTGAAPAEGQDLSAGVCLFGGADQLAVVHVGLTAIALAFAAAGFDLDSGGAVLLSCAAILLLGLPHGALDMAALLCARSPTRAILAYVTLGCAMAALWWSIPGAALLLFFACAAVHFGEDWPQPGLIATGGGLALLAAPLLLHREQIDGLFALIAGPRAIPPLADALLLVAPVAIAAGLTGCALLWISGRVMLASSSVAALAGMVLLPPLAGFTLYFVMFHSPRQFANGLAKLGGQYRRMPVAAASGMGLLLVGGIALLGDSQLIAAGTVRATFIALSVLTVPHMMMPLILRSAS